MNNLIHDAQYQPIMEELDRAIGTHMQQTGDDWDLEAKFPPPDFLTHAEADVFLEKEVRKRAIVRP